MKRDFIKKRSLVRDEVAEIVEYLEVSDQKQSGPARPMFKTDGQKFELHEILLGIVKKLQSIEKAIGKGPKDVKKRARRTKKVDTTDQPSEIGTEELEGEVQG